MSSILLHLPELFNSYKNWVSQNPQLASDCETSAKWISYFIAGKINNSHIVSELVYSLSNLLVLANDRIIANVRQLEHPSSGDTLKLWLTIIEYCEVVFELTAQKVWGTTVKWLIITSIQVFKCISRLLLIYRHKEAIIQTPPLPHLERGQLNNPQASTNGVSTSVADLARAQIENATFVLKSSGKVVRRIDASPPVTLRNWKPLQKNPKYSDCDNDQTIEQALAGRQLIAETIYIVKPIAYLATSACFGRRSWKPWVISLLMDAISLQLYRSCKSAKTNSLTPKQKLQLSKRTLILVMYLLRSPFYDKYSKDKVNAILHSVGRTVPLAHLICGPLAQYLPFWQSNYFYMWST